MRPIRRVRRAFTLIELLVVIAIIAVLIGLLLPAVQKVREAAARSACTNNLKQLATACHMYESANGNLPVNYHTENGWGWSIEMKYPYWSWLARILPMIEQENLYRLGGIPNNNFVQSQAALATPVKTFFCPSDNAAQQQTRTDRANLEGVPIALTNYKGVSGAVWIYGSFAYTPPNTPAGWDGLANADGIFYRGDYKRPLKVVNIRDGSSNTFMIGEDVPEMNIHCSWPYANNAVGTCAIPPNNFTSAPDWPNVYSFRSRHNNGLNFAYADGSVHWVSNSINLATYRAMATINGGETVTPP
jgi:prepilin-type N-terminal cleavage/methylation domain-containing protein/prepilin-type processing-associated H-X9-DG protein